MNSHFQRYASTNPRAPLTRLCQEYDRGEELARQRHELTSGQDLQGWIAQNRPNLLDEYVRMRGRYAEESRPTTSYALPILEEVVDAFTYSTNNVSDAAQSIQHINMFEARPQGVYIRGEAVHTSWLHYDSDVNDTDYREEETDYGNEEEWI